LRLEIFSKSDPPANHFRWAEFEGCCQRLPANLEDCFFDDVEFLWKKLVDRRLTTEEFVPIIATG
jgi:hypothetical protein